MSEQRTNKGWSNLKPGRFKDMDKEELRELCKKGNKRMLEVKQKKKTAKECLNDILHLEVDESIIGAAELPPGLYEAVKGYVESFTMYDLINLVTIGLALGGNMKATEFIRDTVGDAPTKQLNILTENMTTDADRLMMKQLSERLSNPDTVIAHDATPKDNTAALSDKAAAGQEDNR